MTARDGAQAAAASGAVRWLLGGLILVGLATGRAAAEPAMPYARVVVDSAAVRSGPGVAYRRLEVIRRDEVFPIRERATRGYWLLIELPDGTRGFVSGDSVYAHEVGEHEASSGRFLPWLFAPPSLPSARGELTIAGGLLAGGGVFAVRPAWLLDPAFGIEATAMAAVSRGGRLWTATLGPVLNLFPRSPVVPFATLQGGVTATSPNADTFLLASGSIATASAGGGLRFGFRHRLTLRIEARAHAFFEPSRLVAQEEFSAGLSAFF